MGKIERKYLAHFIDSSFGQNATYALTSDSAVNANKTYYSRTGTSGSYVYTAVASPTTEGLSSYYEKTITPTYVRLGKDLEEYNEELNPDVEVNKNILGEQNVQHNGYEVQSEVDPFYAYEGDPLFNQLCTIANDRLTGDDCLTTKVDVLVNASGTVVWAYREDCYVVPSTVGGDTSGVQVPFTVYNAGNRVAGTFNMETKVFTANAS